MAALPNSPLVAAEEYLNSTYRPDKEYVDGILIERSMPSIAHSLLCMILIEYLSPFRKALGFLALPEVRTRIVERARYRIPNLLICPAPQPAGKVITAVPWAAIEIQSPEDKAREQWKRFSDYAAIGTPHMILLDPEESLAFRFTGAALTQTVFTHMDLPTGRMPFDTRELFERLSVELGSGRD